MGKGWSHAAPPPPPPTPQPASSAQDSWAAATRRGAARGGTAYVADLTSIDIADAGLRVVRALCPELCPLDAAHGLRFLGVPRLLTGASDAGLLPRPLCLEEVNPDPHPFP